MPDRLPYRVKWRSRIAKIAGHDCITIRGTIYRRDSYMPAHTHAHEYRHVEQQAEHGLALFLMRYLWQQIRHGYHDNSFEVDARAYADAHAQEFSDMEDHG